ncbi:MAG: hypothetical protein WDO56_12755 [Gammaproteobacteria bacterium]
MNYEKSGVRFSVEECIAGDGRTCWVALVSAKCKFRESDESDCRLASASQGETFEYIVYFIYNDSYGITAMGFADREQTSPEQRLLVATQSILLGDAGLLKIR